MTFIPGARIAEKRHRTAPGGVRDCPNRWVFIRRWNMFSDGLLSRSADDRLFHTVRPCKAKLRWSTDICTLDRSNTSSRCQQQSRTYLNFLHRHAEFLETCRGSIRGPPTWKRSFAALEATKDWTDVVPTSCSRHQTSRSILYWLQPFYLSVSYSRQQSIAPTNTACTSHDICRRLQN